MATLTRKIRIPMLIVGAALAIVGSILPWQCYRGIIYVCLPGLGLQPTALRDISGVHIVFGILVALALYYSLHANWIFKTVWPKAVTAVGIGAWFVVTRTDLVLNGGGLKFVLGAIVVIWVTFRVSPRSTVIALSVTLLLCILATYNAAEAFIPRLAESFGEPESKGRLILLVGELLMLGAVLLERTTHKHRPQIPLEMIEQL